MEPPDTRFQSRYGPWAIVAGASVGLGAEYATQLAARGLNLVLIARRAELLDALSVKLSAEHAVQVRPLALDLAQPDSVERVVAQTRDLEIGLLVYNAGFSAVGLFLDQALDAHLREIETNCRTPLALVHTLGRGMAARGRGGIVLMSSLSASQGSPMISNYAATKAYNLTLAEGLWDELRGQGIDVIACCPGSTDTPGYRASAPAKAFAPALPPSHVVAETLAALGQKPSIIPGRGNRLSAFVMRRILPRRVAIAIMGRTLRAMYAQVGALSSPMHNTDKLP